jgi:hypothetical protein
MGPRDIPPVTDRGQAEDDVELAVLSARAHANDPDVHFSTRIAGAAFMALTHIDAERAKLYVDIIWKSLPEDAQRELLKMKLVEREYMSDFARHYVAEGVEKGKAEGKAEGRAEIILRILRARFGPLPDAIDARVKDACSKELHAVVEEMLTAATLEDALRAL